MQELTRLDLFSTCGRAVDVRRHLITTEPSNGRHKNDAVMIRLVKSPRELDGEECTVQSEGIERKRKRKRKTKTLSFSFSFFD